MATIRVKLIKSYIGCTPTQRRNLQTLGLKRIRQVREIKDTESARGILTVVQHLVEVEKV